MYDAGNFCLLRYKLIEGMIPTTVLTFHFSDFLIIKPMIASLKKNFNWKYDGVRKLWTIFENGEKVDKFLNYCEAKGATVVMVDNKVKL